MFHVKRILIAGFLFSCLNSRAQGSITLQDKPFVFKTELDSVLWDKLKQMNGFSDLEEKEQLFFYWTNYLRQNPTKFYNEVIRNFIKQFPEANTADIVSLQREISESKGFLPSLMPDAGLIKMAVTHCSDLVGQGGAISHMSSSGKNFSQRINAFGSYLCAAENIYVGDRDPLEALIGLLVDYGVRDKGHRKNLLDPRFGKMGVSFQIMSGKKGLLVQDFACQ